MEPKTKKELFIEKQKERYPKGSPVAWNRERQAVLTLHRTEKGNYFTWFPLDNYRLIREAYYPNGDTLISPYKWGREEAIKCFLEYYMMDDMKVKQDAEFRLNEWNELWEHYLKEHT